MARQIEAPITEIDGSAIGGTVTTHPSFAQISASRVSGMTNLYGSDFKHQNYITIRIAPSMLRRTLSNDWPSASVDTLIEVELSEAQWATFVSSLNVGGGPQCTLRRYNGKAIPGLPEPESREQQFKGEATSRMQKAIDDIEELRQEINASKLSQKDKNVLLSKASSIHGNISGNIAFVLDQFGEHMEKTVEKAKIEVNAYAANTLMRAGLDAISSGKALELSYVDQSKDHEQT